VKPVVASVVIDRPPEDVFAYLDTLRKRPEFTDHYLVDWSFSGPQRGVGAKARTRVHTSASNRDWVDVEVIEAKTPERIVEHATGARGKRLTVTTYALQPAEGGSTRVELETWDEKAPRTERVMHPVQRPWLRRVSTRALRRLKENLERSDPVEGSG